MKTLTVRTDIQRLNSIGFMGLSTNLVEGCRKNNVAPGPFDPADLRFSLKLDSFSGFDEKIAQECLPDLIIVLNELISLLLDGLLPLLQCIAIQIFEVLERILAVTHECHYLVFFYNYQSLHINIHVLNSHFQLYLGLKTSLAFFSYSNKVIQLSQE